MADFSSINGKLHTRGLEVATVETFRNRNILINGGFDIWQRGKTFTVGVLEYTTDRWRVQHCTVDKLWDSTYGNTCRLSTFTNNTNYQQRIEANLSGGIYTLSGWIYSNIAVDLLSKVNVENGGAWDSVEKTISLVAGWNKVSTTYDLSGVTTVEASTYSTFMPTFNQDFVALGVTDFRMAQMQLEEGSVATPFEQRPIGYELSLCQRYYETISTAMSRPTYRIRSGALSQGGNMNFKVTKRITPTLDESDVAIVNASGLNFTEFIEGVRYDCTANSETIAAYFTGTLKAEAEL